MIVRVYYTTAAVCVCEKFSFCCRSCSEWKSSFVAFFSERRNYRKHHKQKQPHIQPFTCTINTLLHVLTEVHMHGGFLLYPSLFFDGILSCSSLLCTLTSWSSDWHWETVGGYGHTRCNFDATLLRATFSCNYLCNIYATFYILTQNGSCIYVCGCLWRYYSSITEERMS